MFGAQFVEIVLCGDTFDDAYEAAKDVCAKLGKVFVHPFDDEKVIEGQGTIGLEILQQAKTPIDYIFVAIGGGGLASAFWAFSVSFPQIQKL